MAETVGSIVVGEVVNRTSSFILSKHRERLSTREGIERLEMAYVKMEAALELSSRPGRWQQQATATATDASLLRWRRRLRRAADECDAALRRLKLRELQEEDARARLARAPLPRRVARALLCLASALLLLARGGGDDEHSRARAAVQRFERLAGGAAEFLRCAQLGVAPRRCGGGGLSLGGSLVNARATSTRGCRVVLSQHRHRFLGVGPANPAEVWVDSEPCRA
jgi:hypothetical protein